MPVVVFDKFQRWIGPPHGQGFVAISEGDQRRSIEFFDSAELEIYQLLHQSSYDETAHDDWSKTFQRLGNESISIRVDNDHRHKHMKVSIRFSVEPLLGYNVEVQRQECERMQEVLCQWWETKKATDVESRLVDMEQASIVTAVRP